MPGWMTRVLLSGERWLLQLQGLPGGVHVQPPALQTLAAPPSPLLGEEKIQF